MPKILVTGGAGFIGSNLVDALVEKGNDVVVLDNLSNGKPSYVNKKAKFYQYDVLNNLEQIFKKENFDVVYHLAAQINILRSLKNPLFDTKVNVVGTLNVLQNCIKFDVNKFIFSSSCAVYGNPKYLPCDESHPITPISLYGQNKAIAEQYITLFSRLYGLKHMILRYGNVYGPRQDFSSEGGVVAIFINDMLQNKQPLIFGSGNQTRDFVYVKDVVKANLLALEKCDNLILNIGSGKELPVNDLLDLIKTLFSSKKEPLYKEKRLEIDKIYLDIKKAKEYGFKPDFDIKKGLKETIDFFKNMSKSHEETSFT